MDGTMQPLNGEQRDLDVYADLRQAILRGDYVFGSRLKIDELARRYGVSHMPVRKALLQLAGDGLVTNERNRGASVRSIDLDTVSNIYDVVIALESLLARRAAERMDDELHQKLIHLEEDLERAAERQDHVRAAAVNREFHEAINARAGNPEAEEIVNRYQQLLRAFRRAFGLDPKRLPGVIADHRALLAAFAARDRDGAAAIAAAHASKARNDMLETIRTAAPALAPRLRHRGKQGDMP
jgi:DNA-binding GntR family transcriptional regulator